MTLEPDLDPSIVSNLPPNCRVVSNTRHGSSFWANTSTGRISVILQDGTPQSYFIKVLTGEVGRNILHGEYESMKTIHAVTPDYAPTPVAWGTYTQDPNVHFFLCEYRTMTPPGDQMPDPVPFTQRLSALHMQSGGEAQAQTSPGKKRFGFHVPTYSGYLPQYTGWEDSWEVFFAKSLRVALDLEIRAKGPDPEFDTLVPAIFESVIPRLLRPLESDGRSVKPSLVHGDLWYGNSGVDRDTGECLVFDACCFYAHNEYEFGQWRPACNRFGEEYLAAYRSFVKPSQPEEDYDGRLDLYKLRFNTHVSALFADDSFLRVQMLNDMKDLVQRYA